MKKHSWQGLASPTGLTFYLSLQYEPRLQPQRWETPRAKISADPPALRAPCRGDNEGAWGVGRGARGRAGAGAELGSVPGTGSAEFSRRAQKCGGGCFVPGGGGEAPRGPGLPSSPPGMGSVLPAGMETEKTHRHHLQRKTISGVAPSAPIKLRQVR